MAYNDVQDTQAWVMQNPQRLTAHPKFIPDYLVAWRNSQDSADKLKASIYDLAAKINSLDLPRLNNKLRQKVLRTLYNYTGNATRYNMDQFITNNNIHTEEFQLQCNIMKNEIYREQYETLNYQHDNLVQELESTGNSMGEYWVGSLMLAT